LSPMRRKVLVARLYSMKQEFAPSMSGLIIRYTVLMSVTPLVSVYVTVNVCVAPVPRRAKWVRQWERLVSCYRRHRRCSDDRRIERSGISRGDLRKRPRLEPHPQVCVRHRLVRYQEVEPTVVGHVRCQRAVRARSGVPILDVDVIGVRVRLPLYQLQRTDTECSGRSGNGGRRVADADKAVGRIGNGCTGDADAELPFAGAIGRNSNSGFVARDVADESSETGAG
jgi:hypothetical protein